MRTLIAPLAVLTFGFIQTLPADAKQTLRLTLQLPFKSMLGQSIQSFKEDVEKATRGELEIQMFDSGQLFDDKDVPQAVGSGQIEMGVASLARFAAEVPAVDIFQLPFQFDTEARLRAAVAPDSGVRRPLDDAILAATKARVLWWQSYGSTVLVSKGAPALSPADIKGRRVRISSRLLESWVAANGGTPVDLAGGDQYGAYQRGAVDIGMTGADTIRSRKLWDVMQSVTVVNMAAVEFLVVINEQVWHGLSDAQRKALTDAGKKAEAKLRADFAQLERHALEAAANNKMTVHTPTPAELEAWRSSAATVRHEFLKTAGELGLKVLNAAAWLEQ